MTHFEHFPTFDGREDHTLFVLKLIMAYIMVKKDVIPLSIHV